MTTRAIAVSMTCASVAAIHPFPDGNGRVSRLMSHAMALKAGIGAQGLWSVSRGLARGLDSRREYKTWMDRADTPRQDDRDGRGNLTGECRHAAAGSQGMGQPTSRRHRGGAQSATEHQEAPTEIR